MINSVPLRVVCRRLVNDPNIPVNKIEHLSDIFTDWSQNYINHRLYGETPISLDDFGYAYNALLRFGYDEYALLYLQETLGDPFLERSSGNTVEVVDEKNLHLKLMKSSGEFGRILELAADALKDGKLSLIEILDTLEELIKHRESINKLIAGLQDTKKEIALRIKEND